MRHLPNLQILGSEVCGKRLNSPRTLDLGANRLPSDSTRDYCDVLNLTRKSGGTSRVGCIEKAIRRLSSLDALCEPDFQL
jgi:hypothetical protein